MLKREIERKFSGMRVFAQAILKLRNLREHKAFSFGFYTKTTS